MIKKSTLERIIGDDLSDMWNALRPEEKCLLQKVRKQQPSRHMVRVRSMHDTRNTEPDDTV